MAQDESLLAEVTLRLSRSPEDVATEALAYVLSRSEVARALIGRLAGDWSSTKLRPIVTVRSQAGSDDGLRPDLELQDSSGAPVVIFENKFWAGLTDAQPVSYLRRFSDTEGAVWFVAPTGRIRFLWDDLIQRATKAFPEVNALLDDSELKTARIDNTRVLALTSWGFLLGQIRTALESDGDSRLVADVRQLVGLASRMETSGFIPLTAEDLSAPTARHVVQFCALVDGVVESLLREPFASKKGLKSSAGSGWYGHFVRLHGHGCQISFNAPMWNQYGQSPIWLRVADAKWQYSDSAEHAMVSRLGREDCIGRRDKYLVGVWTPLRLPVGREMEPVLEDVRRQVAAIANCLQDVPANGAPDDAPPEPEPS